MGLRDYQRKRDFKKTSEPRPNKEKGTAKDGALFVIQKHAASRLHYDFRLEMEGVLKSWAVPKGVPYGKGDKRLAVHVEDHPLDYARFEGIIPEGEYGGGSVMVWDIGKYEVSGGDPLGALEEGKLHLRLHGRKLVGEWTLVRTSMGRDGKDQWLLMKTGEAMRPLSKTRDDQSALTGRTMKQIAAARDAQWHSNRLSRSSDTSRSSHSGRDPQPPKSNPKPGGRGAGRPAFIEPMKPKLVNALPQGEGWTYEVKFDGYRAIAIKDGEGAQLLSRNRKPLDFPEVTRAIAALPCRSVVLDGEVVALDERGRPSFQLLQGREMGEPATIRYYLFDLLDLDGEGFEARPLTERKARLAELIRAAGDPLRYSGDLPGTPDSVLEVVKKSGLEGVVAKRADSPYQPGLRTGAWIKLKWVSEQEFVIGGYTQPQGARPSFGSLLIGYFEGEKLRFAGKVGTGFSEKWLRLLHRQFQERRTTVCPFVDLPSKSAGRWNQGITPAQMKKCTWVEPELVCQVKFGEWTRDGKLRQPVFLGMREDKAAGEVTRETA